MCHAYRVTATNVTDAIIEYEQGELDEDRTVILFQYLLDSGLAWSLQGHYGRQTAALLRAGYLTRRAS